MKKILWILFVAIFFCGCNNTQINISESADSISSLSKNQSGYSDNDIYSMKKINSDSSCCNYLGVECCNNYIYTLSEYISDERNVYFSIYDSDKDKTSEINGTHDVLYDIFYYDQKYYTVEFDQDMNGYICRYSSDNLDNECTTLLESCTDIIACGDYICCTGNGVATLLNDKFTEIGKIDFNKYLDNVSSVISTVDEYGCTYFFHMIK